MARSVHPTFLCPNCQTELTKDPQLTLYLANLHEDAEISDAEAKSLPLALRRAQVCPSCGGLIDLRALVDGRLDFFNSAPRIGVIAGMAVFGIFLCLPGTPALWITTLSAIVLGVLAWVIADMTVRSRIAQYRKSPD